MFIPHGKVVIRVRCPYCKFEFNTTSLERTRCMRCLKSFTIFPKKKKLMSRVVGIVRGSFKDLQEERKRLEAIKKYKKGKTPIVSPYAV
jgi:uncharacterized protein YbgA (DUF1722 family)